MLLLLVACAEDPNCNKANLLILEQLIVLIFSFVANFISWHGFAMDRETALQIEMNQTQAYDDILLCVLNCLHELHMDISVVIMNKILPSIIATSRNASRRMKSTRNIMIIAAVI